MGTTYGQVVIGALATLGLTCVGSTVFAQGGPASPLGLHGSRIRTDSPVLRTLVRDASKRSQTFRELVAAIDASDGIVYVRVGACGRLRACLLHRVGCAGRYRVLTILVDLKRPDVNLMGALGHELRHAVEVLERSSNYQ
jgi:hypothetical protein